MFLKIVIKINLANCHKNVQVPLRIYRGSYCLPHLSTTISMYVWVDIMRYMYGTKKLLEEGHSQRILKTQMLYLFNKKENALIS